MDAVVYLREGHAQYLARTNDKRAPPWQSVRHGRTMRPAEPCLVVGVDYVIANDGTDHTLAQLTLELADEASPLKARGGVCALARAHAIPTSRADRFLAAWLGAFLPTQQACTAPPGRAP